MSQNKSIVVLAGEASGDVLGADLIKSIKDHNPHFNISGMGGTHMQEAGANIIVDIQNLDIMGFVEVITNLALIRRTFKTIKQHLIDTRPDLVILIDYPGFNLRMAKVAKKYAKKVLYYVSPQLWAWHYSRIKKIKRFVDHMAVLFPFEVDIYRREGVDVTYVEHPLIAASAEHINHSADLVNKHTVALLPGSRQSEISRLLPEMIKASDIIRGQLPNIEFVLPLAKKVDKNSLGTLPDHIRLIEDNHYDAISQCVAAICTSGTVTLETALLQVPHVITYKCGAINYHIAKRLIKTNWIGLSNIVAEKCIAPELIQQEATAQRIANSLLPILTNRKYRENILNQLKDLREQFQVEQNTNRISDLTLNLLETS